MSHAFYPGTFDPITYGHISIIKRIIPLFETITVGVSCNKFKKPLFSAEERISMIKNSIPESPNLRITSYNKLTVDFAGEINANIIIRGLRAVTDYVSEVQMAIMNRSIEPEIETLLMVAEEGYSFLSSSLIKEIVWHGGPIDHLVPHNVAVELQKRIEQLRAEKSDIDILDT